jgi:hypothetical protein
MSWLFSQALVGEYLVENFSDGEQSAPLNGSHTQQAYCAPDKMTAFSRLSRFGMTYKPLTADRGKELLTLYLEDSRARTSPQPEKAQGLMENDQECGVKWRGSFTKYDPDMRLWKTHQCSLLGDLEPFSETWPQWGLMRDGECWEQRMLEQTIRGTESGLLLPTPDTVNRDNKKVLFDKNAPSQSGRILATYARTWPTPRSCSAMAATLTDKGQRFPNLETVMAHTDQATIGGQLNPMWVEWLMGWPLGWTDLKPLETDKSHCVWPLHGDS